jgi:hypothetical protein
MRAFVAGVLIAIIAQAIIAQEGQDKRLLGRTDKASGEPTPSRDPHSHLNMVIFR